MSYAMKIDGADLGFDLVLHFETRDLAWLEPEMGEPGGWEGRMELMAAEMGMLPLTVPQVLLLVADKRILNPEERERDAWTWVYRRQAEAWTEWEADAPSPKAMAAEAREEARRDAA